MLITDSWPLTAVVVLQSLRLFEYVLRMPISRLPFRAVFARAWEGWKKRTGDQVVTWGRGMNKITWD